MFSGRNDIAFSKRCWIAFKGFLVMETNCTYCNCTMIMWQICQFSATVVKLAVVDDEQNKQAENVKCHFLNVTIKR